MNTLFSTYSQGENRVTSTILAVFERLSFPIVEQILQSIIEESSVDLVSFKNQPKGDDSIPDAQISASFSYWIETKKVPNQVDIDQINSHLTLIEKNNYKDQHLIILTPDTEKPEIIDTLNESNRKYVSWTNFDGFINAIDGAISIDDDWLSSDKPIPNENEREMLRELVHFITSEDLLDKSEDRVLIVPAKRAYPEYLKNGFYFCQPNRSFQPSARIGFYCEGEIKPEFPKIINEYESIRLEVDVVKEHEELSSDEKDRLIEAIQNFEKYGINRKGDDAKVLFLSSADSGETLKIKQPIKNNLKSKTGRNTAFTQYQRYVTAEAIQTNPDNTSQLLELLNR